MAFTPKPLAENEPSGGRFFSIEIRLMANGHPRSGVTAIMVVYDMGHEPALLLGQWDSCLVVRKLDWERRDGKKWQEASICRVLENRSSRHITIIFSSSETVFYVDGRIEKRYPGLSFVPESGTLIGKYLLLGNLPDVPNGWTGEIQGLALYNRFLSEEEVGKNYQTWGGNPGRERGKEGSPFLLYDFTEEPGINVSDLSGNGNDLRIPAHAIFTTKMLAPVQMANLFTLDFVLNVFGFIPFGFSVTLWFRRRFSPGLAAASAILGGCAASLSIELIQVHIPVRDSSQLDLICNTFGSTLGVISALIFSKKVIMFSIFKLPSAVLLRSRVSAISAEHDNTSRK